MKKTLYSILVLSLTTLFSFGQKQAMLETYSDAYSRTFAKLHYWNYLLNSTTDTATVKSIIKSELNFSEDDDLIVTHIAQSLTATHITFKQVYKGNEVFGGGAKVAVSNNKVLFRCIETLFATTGNISDLPIQFDATTALQEFNNIEILKNKAVYLFDGSKLEPGWYASFLVGENGHFEAAWFKNGSRYFLHDLLSYSEDTVATFKVFNPDPITPISKTYGGIYVDNNDGNEPVLNPLRETVQMNVTLDNDTFYLKNDFVDIVEASSPVNPVITSTTPMFDFSRTDYGFEQANAYFHINSFQEYLQTLGYSLVQYAIRVDAQGWNGQDNSSFNSGALPLPLLTFGEGGVDDAEDADVVVHEYGHAISHSASPNTNTGNERRSLDEAVGDYFAVTYKKAQYSFGSDYVFNWDGHNVFWNGRTVNNPDNYCYTTIPSFNSIYTYTTLWNAAMFDIWNQLGKTYTDKLQLEALYGYYNNMSFRDAALMVLDADSALTGGGANSLVIWKAFDDRCILNWSAITEKGKEIKPYVLTNSLCSIANPARINVDAEGFSVSVYDLTGTLIFAKSLEPGVNELLLKQHNSGMYILIIQKDGYTYREKIVLTK